MNERREPFVAQDPAFESRVRASFARQRFMATQPAIWAQVGSAGAPLIDSVLQDSSRPRRDLRQQALTDFCWGDASCGASQQPKAEPCLQPIDRVTQR